MRSCSGKNVFNGNLDIFKDNLDIFRKCYRANNWDTILTTFDVVTLPMSMALRLLNISIINFANLYTKHFIRNLF